MPSKVAEWMPSHGQRTSSHLVRPEFDLDATGLPANPRTTPQLSLHAHPRQIYRLRSLSGQQHTESADIPANLIIPKRRLYSKPILQPIVQRRTRVTSQGTVIINRQPEHHILQRTGSYTDAVDDLRSQAERGYYEQHDGNGIIRRSSMLRAVSKDDYLLGRGANPRTGLITPGGGSIDSNIDETDISLERNPLPSAKWRQQGDQWVSLDVDQPTPLAEPLIDPSPALLKVPTPRVIQRQSKWCPGRLRRASQEDAKSKRDHPEEDQVAAQAPVKTVNNSDVIPDNSLRVLVTHDLKDQIPPQTKDKVIRRKPVGESPLKDKFKIGNLFSPKLHNTKPPTPPRYLREEDRSFSAPQLPKQSLSPDNVSQTPSLMYDQAQAQKVQSNPQQNKHFLGVRSQTLGNLNQQFEICQTSPATKLDKALPCLPMSNGPYPSIRSEKLAMSSAESTPTKRIHTAKMHSQYQEQNSNSMEAGSRRSHIADLIVLSDQSKQNTRSEWTTGQGICAIPDYDNPPRSHVLKSRTPVVVGPRSIPKTTHARRQRPALADVFTDPYNIITTSTDTFIPMPKDLDLGRQLNKRSPPRAHPPPTIPLPSIPHPKYQRKVSLPNTMVTDNQNIVDSSPPCIAPRGMARPNMPSRAIGLQKIPTIEEPLGVSSKMCTDVHNLLNPIGIKSNESQMRNIVNLPRQMAFQSGQHLTPNNATLNTTGSGHNIDQTSNTDRTRRCSRCQDGLIVESHHGIDGQTENAQHSRLSTRSANAPEALELLNIPTPITEITEPRSSTSSMLTSGSDVSATVRDVVGDLRDHSICCPDCCIMDCHEACLGHSRPSQVDNEANTEDEMNLLRRVDSSSTLVSTSGKSSTAGSEDEPKTKISFIKSTFKIPLWYKKATGVAHKNSDDSLVQQTLRTHTITKPATKTVVFKQFDRTVNHDGAVAAAKKAIGADSSASSTEKTRTKLFVPKKRAHKKPANLEIPKIDEVKELSSSPIKVSVAANECRKISTSRPCSVSQSSVMLHPSQSRTLSNGSTDISFPSIDSMGVSGLSQALFTVPFEAIHMWLYNNPQVMGFGKSAVEFAWLMGCEVAVTAQLLLNAVYIYSKTGKLKVKDEHGLKISPWQLMVDTFRSLLYLLVFISLSIIVMRIVRIFFLPLRLLFSLCRCLIVGGRKVDSV